VGQEQDRSIVRELGFAVSDATVGRILSELIKRGRVPAVPALLRKIGPERLSRLLQAKMREAGVESLQVRGLTGASGHITGTTHESQAGCQNLSASDMPLRTAAMTS
jgi:hypothetical protein